MSEGPIKQGRDGFKAPKATTSNAGRVCQKSVLAARAYCGRKPKVSFDEWTRVTCADCHAARRADEVVP